MALTKRQRTLVAVFVIGLAGLIVDRVWVLPDAASADSPGEPADRPVSPAPRPSSHPTPDKQSVAHRLDSLWPEREPNFADLRDPFCLPSSWSGASKDGPGAAEDAGAAFAATHRLSAVLVEGDISYALVGDRFLTPGQEIDGFKLVLVQDHFAVFEGRGSRVVLELMNE